MVINGSDAGSHERALAELHGARPRGNGPVLKSHLPFQVVESDHALDGASRSRVRINKQRLRPPLAPIQTAPLLDEQREKPGMAAQINPAIRERQQAEHLFVFLLKKNLGE